VHDEETNVVYVSTIFAVAAKITFFSLLFPHPPPQRGPFSPSSSSARRERWLVFGASRIVRLASRGRRHMGKNLFFLEQHSSRLLLHSISICNMAQIHWQKCNSSSSWLPPSAVSVRDGHALLLLLGQMENKLCIPTDAATICALAAAN
jgi:hypothetical protein